MTITRLVLVTAIVAAAVTAAATTTPSLAFTSRNTDLHLAFVVSESMIALLAGYLALGRLRQSRRIDHLLLGAGLAFLGFSSLLFMVLPDIFWEEGGVFATWATATGRLCGSLLLAAAALATTRRLRLSTRRCLFVALATLLLLVGIALLGLALQDSLPVAVDPVASPELGRLSGFDGHPLLFAMLLAGVLTYAVAAFGFARRASRSGDALLGALAVGCAVAAAAYANYLAYPSSLTEWVTFGDVLRFCFYLTVLLGVVREIDAHWQNTRAAAALEERRRIARDLHDGLAQELASVHRNLSWLGTGNPFVDRAMASAERGLRDARRAIAVLSDGTERDFAEMLAEAAGVVATREGIAVVLDLSPKIRVGPAEREALIRIASEAITNAARHGSADTVQIELVDRPRVRLRISDAGSGFDPTQVKRTHSNGFGLLDMRERALGIGARYRLDSRPGFGTEVEVAL